MKKKERITVEVYRGHDYRVVAYLDAEHKNGVVTKTSPIQIVTEKFRLDAMGNDGWMEHTEEEALVALRQFVAMEAAMPAWDELRSRGYRKGKQE